MEREYRFVGGPWHGEQHVMDGRQEWLVPIRERVVLVAATPPTEPDLSYPGIKCAVYRLSGDYAAEKFYKFKGIERR